MARYRKRLEELEAYQFIENEWKKGNYHKGGGRVLDNVYYDEKTKGYRVDTGGGKTIPIEEGQFVAVDDRGKIRVFMEELFKFNYQRIS